MTDTLVSRAMANHKALSKNPYPGRGLLVGLTEDGRFIVQASWTMGRNPKDSGNRVYEELPEGSGHVFTAVADPAYPPKDPKLTIYPAMRELSGFYVASNGHQTDDVFRHARDVTGFLDSLRDWQYEPDPPNYTPRITCLVYLESRTRLAQIAILKRAEHDDSCIRQLFTYPTLPRGVGYCVTTYEGDGNPLPSFKGEPYPVWLGTGIESPAEALWDALNPDNRVSIAVKKIDVETGESTIEIINKNTKVVL